jgi:prepilin-type N-terminal cleavage/methylation domain-containing protein
MNNITHKSGFTLIELLVVITIIGILSAVLYGSFSEARQDAKNKAVQSEIKETQLAIELYKAQNGVYPEAFDVGASGCASTNAGVVSSRDSACGSNPYIVGLVPDFIAELPDRDNSANENCDIVYQVDTAGSWYKLTAVNCHAGAESAAEGIGQDNEFARCPTFCAAVGPCDPTTTGFYESYSVYSAGGQCE